MSIHFIQTLPCVIVSVVMLLILVKASARRHHKSEREVLKLSALLRRAALAASIFPGVYLTLVGNGAGVLVWIGSLSLLGWLLAHLPTKWA